MAAATAASKTSQAQGGTSVRAIAELSRAASSDSDSWKNGGGHTIARGRHAVIAPEGEAKLRER